METLTVILHAYFFYNTDIPLRRGVVDTTVSDKVCQ